MDIYRPTELGGALQLLADQGDQAKVIAGGTALSILIQNHLVSPDSLVDITRVAGLNRIVDMCIPVYGQEGGTMVIPGHGRLCDMAEVVYYRDMLSIISDRIQDAIKRGLTLQQIKTAKLIMDFDARWGSTSGPWTTDMFIEAVYKSLSKKP